MASWLIFLSLILFVIGTGPGCRPADPTDRVSALPHPPSPGRASILGLVRLWLSRKFGVVDSAGNYLWCAAWRPRGTAKISTL